MSKENKGGAIPVLVRFPPDVHEHIVKKTEESNKERKKELKPPTNRQDTIREIVRQDAVTNPVK